MTIGRLDHENRQQFRLALTEAAGDGTISEQEATSLVRDADRFVRESAEPEVEGEYYRDELSTASFRGAELASNAERIIDGAMTRLPPSPTGRDQRARELFALGLVTRTERDQQMSEYEMNSLLDDAREDMALADDGDSLKRFYRSELDGLYDRGFEVDGRAWESVYEFLRELDGQVAPRRDEDEGPVFDD